MTIPGWGSREKNGALLLLSPNGDQIVEAREIHETGGMGGPKACDIWVNGKKIVEQFDSSSAYVCFSPTAAWSPDSNYLALILWTKNWGNPNFSQLAVYDVKTETLRALKNRAGKGAGYLVSNFEYEIKKAIQNGANLHEVYGTSLTNGIQETHNTVDLNATQKSINRDTGKNVLKPKVKNVPLVKCILLFVFIVIFVGRLKLYLNNP